MLTLLKIRNFALIDDLSVEFGSGLNLLTGETGSGKSIIVDSLSALTGERVYSELIKEGEARARIEGIFEIGRSQALADQLEEGGIEFVDGESIELLVRRELSASGRNRVFVNDQLVTQGFLKKLGVYLADIHGQGEQTTLFSPGNHLEILDSAAGLESERNETAERYASLAEVLSELSELKSDEAEKLQLLDILRFQADEINRAKPAEGEDDELEEEKKRLNNVGKLSELSDEAHSLLYESEGSVVGNVERVRDRIRKLAEFDLRFAEYEESLESAHAVLEDLAYTVRDFAGSLEFSPDRLEEIEDRLAELGNLKRKYGGSIETVLAHLEEAEKRLANIETAEEREQELRRKASVLRDLYLDSARDLHEKREAFAREFEATVEKDLAGVALEKARFVVSIECPDKGELENHVDDRSISRTGFDRIEFLFSANPGESPKPLAKVASGGEASRLMLILKTAARLQESSKAAVFDEIDAGIGGRVAEAVGLKLKELSSRQQVLCVTHQPQVASLADLHFIVEKSTDGKQTRVSITKLDEAEQVAEIARMLAGEKVSNTAREHAKEMLKAAR
ncbi:MAG: DNA repair protein RecN [Acidobacteria bacterium]|nr:MAG: DNA repair protein RecN [Acidobacteriota bacterium]REJ99168.1 MAG: DNA repair protein RecN [Acidobacteriota bacterium]REK16111.1 MAG: DNA repair protein RecN [Acidobacteriota bacterium]REK43792.1 MAG: DNA repair protein RecN [Acidobacteriota bacterium]